MALVISSENFKDNEIGAGNGGIQPSEVNSLNGMRLNNGAPTRNGTNDDVINYDNNGKENPFQDRVVSSKQGENTSYTFARNGRAFELIDREAYEDDNGTQLGNVTLSGEFHYVAPKTNITTDNADKRKAEIEKIYMVGSVNAMSARS